jgi:serine/threonine protein kinase
MKPDNLLLNEAFDIKLADFGMAAAIAVDGAMRTTRCGTDSFMSPELLSLPHGQAYDPKPVDVFACGCILFIFLVGGAVVISSCRVTLLNSEFRDLFEVFCFRPCFVCCSLVSNRTVPPFNRAAADDWWYSRLVNGHHAAFWSAHEQQAAARHHPRVVSAEAKQLLQAMLCLDPAQRITAPAILGDAFTNGERYEYVSVLACLFPPSL